MKITDSHTSRQLCSEQVFNISSHCRDIVHIVFKFFVKITLMKNSSHSVQGSSKGGGRQACDSSKVSSLSIKQGWFSVIDGNVMKENHDYTPIASQFSSKSEYFYHGTERDSCFCTVTVYCIILVLYDLCIHPCSYIHVIWTLQMLQEASSIC